jgi:hypothetical protein
MRFNSAFKGLTSKKNSPSSHSVLRPEVSSVKGYGVYRSLSSRFPYLTDLGVCASGKNMAVCGLWVLQPSAASGSLYLSKYILSGRMIQMKITKIVYIYWKPCVDSPVTGTG